MSDELTVKGAIKELRDMWPNNYRRIEQVEVEGPSGPTEGSFVLINIYDDPDRPLNGFVYEYGETLEDVMRRVRAFKQSHAKG